ncbi:MAG TPA: phosphoglucosamine mutase [Bacteriovoracaceae bacterium]|nr:phosphoglucosamine mutase [Bacteriovoracaceae bacterium]
MSGRKLFGTDGIRGKANTYPMTGEVAFVLGRAVTSYFQKSVARKPLIIIGKDTRLSCYMLEQAFSAGVCSQGGKAILTGPLPTPGVAFVTQSMRADAGVMISASHNSYEDNGIKIFDRTGHKLPDEIELELENMVLNPGIIPVRTGDQLGNAKRLDEVIGRYIVHTKAALSPQYSLEGLRIVVDGANGAGYKLAPIVFEELGAEVVALGNTPNGTNINKACGALHPGKCAETVKLYRADLGVCLDGDGDRLTIVDRNGEVLHGDKLIGICGKFLKDSQEIGPTAEVVGTVMSNFGLEYYLKEQGLNFIRTQVGDRYIVEHMRQSGALFGGEPSGHLVFKRYSTTGDGILAALKVIESIKFYDKDLSEMAEGIELFPQMMENIVVQKRVPFAEVLEIAKAMKMAEEKLGKEGRILLRYSGTEPLARIMVEGRDTALVSSLCTELTSVVNKALG